MDSVVLIVSKFGETSTLKSGRASVTFNLTRTDLTIAGLDVSCPVTFKT